MIICLLRFFLVIWVLLRIFCRKLCLTVLSSAILYTVALYYTTEVVCRPKNNIIHLIHTQHDATHENKINPNELINGNVKSSERIYIYIYMRFI
jgi:hypothetical protein